MIRRLLRGTVKLSIIAGAVTALVVIGRKLMGGLGPEPGSDGAPKEWPPLVPESTNAESTSGSNGSKAPGNGASAADSSSSGATSPAHATDD